MQDVALKVLEYIRKNPGASYTEVERVFEEVGFQYKGDYEIYDGEFQNIIFWTGWNKEAIELIVDLQQQKLIAKELADPIIYLIDGKSLRLPLVEHIKQYSTPHWLPIGFVATPQIPGA
ncbi:pathogenicity island protein [Lysinibacillus sp. KU-BSD001]|uniref:pathogenicity island protein n=1 Tax=Lysinibacillus sp. KU-BSD001 TaxID=3141328 RepID=UPI0036EB8914